MSTQETDGCLCCTITVAQTILWNVPLHEWWSLM